MAAPRALLEIAQQHEKKGNLAKAAKAYSEHLSNTPSDSRILLRLAEIQERLGEDAVAADAFHQLGMMHSKDGIEAKAAAAFRRALDLMPTHTASVQPLAELLVRSGKKRDAVNTLETGSRAAAAAGDVQSQLKMLERAAQLDEGFGSKLAYAQCLAESGQKTPAIALLRQALDRLDEQRAPLERLQILEQLVQISSGDAAVALETANAAVRLRDHRRALVTLRIALEREPENPDLISLVGAVLGVMGEEERALLVFREAARTYGRIGRGDNARKCWGTVLRLSPDDPEARAEIGAVPTGQPSTPSATGSVSPSQAPMPPATGAVAAGQPSTPRATASVSPSQAPMPPAIGVVPTDQPSTSRATASVSPSQAPMPAAIGAVPTSQPSGPRATAFGSPNQAPMPAAIGAVPTGQPSAPRATASVSPGQATPPAIGAVAPGRPATSQANGPASTRQRSALPRIGPVPPSQLSGPAAIDHLLPPSQRSTPPAIGAIPTGQASMARATAAVSPSQAAAPSPFGSVLPSHPSVLPPGPLADLEMSEMDDVLSSLCEHFPANPSGPANLDPGHQIEISVDDFDLDLSIEPDPDRDNI